MQANLPRTRIWRSQHLKSIELIHGVHQNYASPRHFHEELELNLKQGDGWQFNYRGSLHNVPSDTLVITQPGEAHQADSESDLDCTFRGLRVSMDLLQQVATDVAGRDIELPLFSAPIVHDRDFNTKFIRVHQTIERSTSQLEQQTLTLDLLAQLILRYAENPPDLDKLGTEIQPVHRVRDYLEEHADREISLEQLSRVANLSSFHLNRSFSKTFGMPPHAYQIQMRILQAKRLLRKEHSITSGRLRQRASSHRNWICQSKSLWIALQTAGLRYAEAIHSRQQECDRICDLRIVSGASLLIESLPESLRLGFICLG